MTAQELQDTLLNLIETAVEARAETETEDPDITVLADFAQDIAENVEDGMTARAYSRDMMLTTDAGLTVRTEEGAEFQITIVQTKRGTTPDEGDEG
jgi:hypothetical protein